MSWRIGWVPFSALFAAQAVQAQSVGYEETLAAVRGEQPLLEAGALRVQARREAAEAADELPDPRVRAGVMNLPVTGPAAFDPYEQLPTQIAIGVEQEIPNLARRRARYAIAGSADDLGHADKTGRLSSSGAGCGGMIAIPQKRPDAG